MITNKKILVVTTTDNMIWQFLIPHIEDLIKSGNVVECACAETGFWFKELEEKYNFTMRKIDFPRAPLSTKTLKSRKALFNLVKENKYDLIYCHQPVGGVMGRMAGHKFKIPVIYVAHGFHFFKGCPKKNLLYKFIEKHYSRYTDALVTMNEEDYQSALKFKAKRVYKINGIGFDLNKYAELKETKEEIRETLGLTNNDFVVTTIAEFIERKNYPAMLKAIAEAVKKDSNIKFLICGRGRLESEINDLIEELKITENVCVLGYRKDINRILTATDVFMIASYHEGLTLSVIEAMNFAIPCVVSDVRGNHDLIDHYKGGFVVEANDFAMFAQAILELCEDNELYKNCAVHNKNKVTNYSIDVVIEQMRKIYGDTFNEELS